MKYFCLLPLFLITGCFNMPTAPAQITGSYVSTAEYNNYSCHQLTTEFNSLVRRENQLVVAQEQRINSSEVQAFWYGFGQGDGLEASELANVRGKKEAIQYKLTEKMCKN